MMLQKRNLYRLAVIFVVLVCTVSIYSCEETPSDLGLIYISPDDTTGTNVLESQADTMLITSTNFKLALNTSPSNHIMIGRSGSYESNGFIKFFNITPNYDSANIISAELILTYDDYFFKDSLGSVSFDAFRIKRDIINSTFTRDSLLGTDLDNTSLGTFTGAPVDTAVISMPLNNQLVKDWLESAANTSYPVPNYGIGLLANGSSTAIKGFFTNSQQTFFPYVRVILSKNNDIDTITFGQSSSMFLSNVPESIIPADRFFLQSGIAFKNILKFDLSKLPSNVIVNDARLELTLDRTNSFLTPETNTKLGFGIVTDSVKKTDTLLSLPANQTVTGDIYQIKITPLIQYWNSGILPNYGATLFSTSERINLDLFSFFAPSYSDLTKVPKLRIIYTLRN